MRWLFLLAYTCSGMAGLIYEVTWTRLLTLYVGHTTAAASAVVAAFLGGLAAGAWVGGRLADRLTPQRTLRSYVWLELLVAALALVLPLELSALTPLLRWAYADGAPGLLFPIVRIVSCLLMVFVPATALGATFPLVRQPRRQSGTADRTALCRQHGRCRGRRAARRLQPDPGDWPDLDEQTGRRGQRGCRGQRLDGLAAR